MQAKFPEQSVSTVHLAPRPTGGITTGVSDFAVGSAGAVADGAGAGMTNQSIFGGGSRLVFDVLMNSQNQQFIYQGISALLMGGGFSGTFTTYGVTVAVNGAALPATALVDQFYADVQAMGGRRWDTSSLIKRLR